ncbi:hypothetical protein AgCh_017507 [Apium graveolens]
MGVSNDLSEGSYLGLPSLIGHSKKRVFSFIKDRVELENIMNGYWWKTNSSSTKDSKQWNTQLMKNCFQDVDAKIILATRIPQNQEVKGRFQIEMRSRSNDNDGQQEHMQIWMPPMEGNLKLNVDASVIQGSTSFRVSMVLRDFRGHFIQGKCMHYAGEVTTLKAETFVIYEAFSWMLARSGQSIQIESDSLVAVNSICSRTINHLDIGHVFELCREIMQYRPDLSLHFVRKQVNEAAHLMAHVPCELNSYKLFLSPTFSVLETIVSEFLVI